MRGGGAPGEGPGAGGRVCRGRWRRAGGNEGGGEKVREWWWRLGRGITGAEWVKGACGGGIAGCWGGGELWEVFGRV